MKYFISFCYFHFGNFDINFVEIFLKKPFLGQKSFLGKFSKVLLKLFHVTIFKATLDSKMAAIIIFYFEDDIVFGYSHKIPGSIIRCFMTIIEKLSFQVLQVRESKATLAGNIPALILIDVGLSLDACSFAVAFISYKLL